MGSERRQPETAKKFNSTFSCFSTSAVVNGETVEFVHVMFKESDREGC